MFTRFREKITFQELMSVFIISFIASLPILNGNSIRLQCFSMGINFLTAVVCFICMKDLFHDIATCMIGTSFYTLSIYLIGLEVSGNSVVERILLAFFPLVIDLIFHFYCKYNKIPTVFLGGIIIFVIGTELLLLILFQNHFFSQPNLIKDLAQVSIQDKGLYISHFFIQFWDYNMAMELEQSRLHFPYLTGLGIGPMSMIFLFVGLWFRGNLKQDDRGAVFAKISFVFAMILLIACLDVFPWDRLQMMNRYLAIFVGGIGYPGRMIGIVNVFLLFPIGYNLSYFKKKSNKMYWGLCIFLIACLMTSNLFFIDSLLYA